MHITLLENNTINMNLDKLVLQATEYISSEFSISLEKTQLKSYSNEQWEKFCDLNYFNKYSEGIYIPESYTAYINTKSEVLESNIFHELYGHGLFVEHSNIGKQLMNIIQNKGDEKKYLFDEINPQEQFFGLAKHNIQNYEGFAVWLEALICEETGNKNIWELKKNKLPEEYIELFDYFKDFEKNYSRFGLISQLGFPKFYNNKDVVEITKRIYKESFENIELIIIYGSKKPESDIDLFIISDKQSKNYFNGWLDIYELNKNEFEKLSANLDISVTDPIFTGELIYGNTNSFEQLKQKIEKQTITQNTIKHNLNEAEKQKNFLKKIHKTDKRKKDCLSYINSFSKNAELLSKGYKALTLKNIKNKY